MRTPQIISKTKNLAVKKKEEMYTSAVAVSSAVIAGEAFVPMASAGVTDDIKKAMDDITAAIVKIGTPLYGMVAAICIVIMVAASGQKVQLAKDWLVRATIGYVALLSLSAITTFVGGLGGK